MNHICSKVVIEKYYNNLKVNIIWRKKSLIDLKSSFSLCHTSTSIKQEIRYELRENNLFTTNGIPSYIKI